VNIGCYAGDVLPLPYTPDPGTYPLWQRCCAGCQALLASSYYYCGLQAHTLCYCGGVVGGIDTINLGQNVDGCGTCPDNYPCGGATTISIWAIQYPHTSIDQTTNSLGITVHIPDWGYALIAIGILSIFVGIGVVVYKQYQKRNYGDELEISKDEDDISLSEAEKMEEHRPEIGTE